MNAVTPRLAHRQGVLTLDSPWGPVEGTIRINDEPVAAPWQVAVVDAGDGALRLEVTNTSAEPRALRTVVFARWAPWLDTARFVELVHGASFHSLFSGVKPVGRKSLWLDYTVPSSLLTVYQEEDGEALLLGVLPPVGTGFAEAVTVHDTPHLEGRFGFELRHRFDCTVAPGASVTTSAVIALAGRDGVGLMARFGELWRQRLERPTPRKPYVGWNSWDYYSGAVTREAMDHELAAGVELFGDAFQALVIDEGWERQWGSWVPNGKFAEGLADFCAHVKAAGRVPGVWTAPLLCNVYNPLYLEHPDWFAGRADGQIQTDSYSYGPMAYLDPTQPQVIEHLEGIFRRLRADGFEYFKVDFSHCILNAVQFQDKSVGRADLIRRAFAAIRRAIGPDAYLLSCGTPYESVVGLCDAARTTGDIHIYWGHVLQNAANVAARFWMHGNLFNGDPDFLVVRGPETAEGPFGRRQAVQPMPPQGGWVSGRELNESEARTYALIVHLSGGDVILGDALRQLKPNGLAMLKQVLTPRPQGMVPVDLFTTDQDVPQIWLNRGADDVLVGLFNWRERTARIDFDPAKYGLTGTPTDFWTGEPVTELPTKLARRSSVGLVYKQ